MKVTINIDCTPEEARTFLGLPDVRPMQDALLKEAQTRMTAGLQAMDAESLIRGWLSGPGGALGAAGSGAGAGAPMMEQLQKAFWSQMMAAMGQTALTPTTSHPKPQGETP